MQRAPEKIKIGLVTDGGKIDDGSFTQFTYEGIIEAASNNDLAFEVVETTNPADLHNNIDRLLKRGCEIIVTIGIAGGPAAENLAKENEEAHFITVNHRPAPESHNVAGIIADAARALDLKDLVREEVERYLKEGRGGAWQAIRSRLLDWNLNAALIPLLAIVTALIIGAVVIAAFDPEVWEAFSSGIFRGIGKAFQVIGTAYSSLFEGAFGNPGKIIRGTSVLISTGDDTDFRRSITPIMESLRLSTPYIFTGLAVALGFRCGLFNIGAEGQYFIGGLASVFVGYALVGTPWFIHLPLAVFAGALGGALWAAIAGFLKARTGAHEVINTIMLNYIAFQVADFMLQVNGPMSRPGDNRPVSPMVLESSYLPQFFPNDPSIRTNVGLILALFAVWFVYWLLFKTTLGFEIRSVGANPRAARTAGIKVESSFVVAMGLSGGLAGLAGSHDILGVTRFMPNAFYSGYGFDAIALALMGKSHPVGVMLAAFLFGFLRAGAQRMQGYAHVPIDIIAVLQGLIIMFIAAPELIRMIYRIRAAHDEGEAVFTRGWGSV